MKRRSDKTLSVDLTGMAMAMQSERYPVMMELEGAQFVIVCSTKEKLETVLAEICVKDASIKRITDGKGFIKSILFPGSPARIMLDPYVHEGNTRFTEVLSVQPGENN